MNITETRTAQARHFLVDVSVVIEDFIDVKCDASELMRLFSKEKCGGGANSILRKN
jgi:hypothetical protein